MVQPPSALKEGGEWNDLPFLTSLQSVGQRIHCIILNRESYSVLYCMYVYTIIMNSESYSVLYCMYVYTIIMNSESYSVLYCMYVYE